ncbi:MFS transporter, partial [Streptomyces sp. NPDC059003]|uniref:MFS transporter n=1 Tax=Streptomyces sp. NPDC059003 TaxID=3346691 RepID=UPI0036A1643C
DWTKERPVTEPAPRPTPVPARLPGTYWLLIGGFALARSGGVVVPFLSLYLVTHLDHSAADAAHISAAFGVGWLLGPLLAGMFTDRLGRRATLQIALLGTAGACLALSQARSLPALGAAAFAVGLLFDAARPAVTTLVTDLVPAPLRARAFGRLYWAMNLGTAIASVLGALLVKGHFAALFLLDGAASCLLALLVCAVRDPRPAPAAHRSRPALAALLRDRPFLALCAATLGWLCVYQQMLFGLPLAMRGDGLEPSSFGVIGLANAAGVLLLQPLLQPLVDRCRPVTVCTAGAGLTATGMGANLFADHLLAYTAATAVWTAGEVLFLGAAMTIVADLAPAHARGRYAGVWSCTLGLSALIAPQLAALAFTAGGSTALWIACAVLGAAAAAMCAALRPALDARRQPQPAPAAARAPAGV